MEKIMSNIDATDRDLPAVNYVDDAKQLEGAQHISSFSQELVGVKAKLALSAHAISRADGFHMAHIDNIVIMQGLNLRTPGNDLDAYIRSLADNMKINGFLPEKAIAVYATMQGKKAVFVTTDGHCRYAAAQLARSEGCGIDYLPIFLSPVETTIEDVTVTMITTSGTRKLRPYEVAIGCKRLRSFGVRHEVIAQRLNITVEYVHQLLELAGAPLTIRHMVENGEVTAALAINTMRAEGASAAAVLNSALTVAKLEGKSKVTAKDLPGQMFKKMQKKTAGRMLDALTKVHASKQFNRLPADARQIIEEVLKEFESLGS